jgi:hypothetical protein
MGGMDRRCGEGGCEGTRWGGYGGRGATAPGGEEGLVCGSFEIQSW